MENIMMDWCQSEFTQNLNSVISFREQITKHEIPVLIFLHVHAHTHTYETPELKGKLLATNWKVIYFSLDDSHDYMSLTINEIHQEFCDHLQHW
jgi:hypothetical protein